MQVILLPLLNIHVMVNDRTTSKFKQINSPGKSNIFNMRKQFPIQMLLFILISIFFCSATFAQDGATTFKTVCAACHTIGKGKLVGPDLAGVTERRSEDWLIKFVKSSQSLIKSGDKTADSIFQAYNQVMMPDQPLDDAKIKEVLAYIHTTASAAPAETVTASGTVAANQSMPTQKWQWSDFFTFPNTVLLVMILIMLIIIIALTRINNRLTEQLLDLNSSDRTFFRK